ncbi:hypothetical protein Bca52824_059453 [Brassica carinata]|uniref:Uncharacterized protein n=1 Tax=Brassica carinata TaxID=52824 RepID=A0A8X7QWK2_BRACI|nr:hypothetical protein Bca52824_059453 [Brassica carinata]
MGASEAVLARRCVFLLLAPRGARVCGVHMRRREMLELGLSSMDLQVQLSIPPPPLLFFIFPASVASAPAEDTGSLYRRFALVSFKFLFQFRLPPVLTSGRCRLPPFGSRRRLKVEQLVFSLGMWIRSPLQWFPLLNRQSQCRVSSLDWAWCAGFLTFLRSVSSLVLVVAAVSGPIFCKNCLSANGYGGDLRVSMELELKRMSWDS